MCKYSECNLRIPCSECDFFEARYSSAAICKQFDVVLDVLGPEKLREQVKLQIQKIKCIQAAHRDLLYSVSYAEERKLSEKDKQLCEIWDRYQKLLLDITPWLNGSVLDNTDRKALYKFFQAADSAEFSLKER